MTDKILIIDDEPDNLDVLDNCLDEAGFEVRIANSGEAAIKQVPYIKPDLILLDVKMPGIDGFETFRRLKEKEVTKDTPVIFLTIADNTADKIKGFEAGAVDYITKPFHAAEAVARINKHLTVSKLRKLLEEKNAQLQDYVYHLQSLAALGKAVNEARDVTQMMDNAMKVTLSVFDCDRAWLLYPCDPNAPSWRVPIEITAPDYPGAHLLNTDITMDSAVSEIMTDTLSAAGPIAFGSEHERKLPAKIVEQFSIQSQLCAAIHPKIGKPWMFGLHQCSYARDWTENERSLFREFGQQIAVGLGFSISFEELQKSEKRLSRRSYYGLTGASKPMQAIYHIIDNVAASNASVLIAGENGTGKELCAEAVYKESKRADKPFVVCNCAAIPEKLMESHLFGHVKGAFTGAVSLQKGLVSKADGGTLFLDEIGELPLSMQSALLRFVQTRTFCKVGSHTLEQVDVRLVCATNRDLPAEIKAGRFREDLYYRINTIEMKLPALRERGRDILLLAEFFLHRFAKEEQKDFHAFSAEAENKLLRYAWPGNVRQLQNTIHNAVILNKGKQVAAEMLSDKINENINDNNMPLLAESAQAPEPVKNHSASANTIAVTSGDTFRPLKDIDKGSDSCCY
ncbi:MAG: response regulator [Gammaproteobacteria bacterium]|nr:response regulator [Gammaproteobacteria bacterium]